LALSSGSRLGPYEILAPLGAGGMGEVYRARDTRLGRSVAIKVLPERISLSRDSRERFEREAKTISQLAHPHICALYDVGEEGSVAYIVMEYLEGQTLADRLAKGALPLDQAFVYAREIASALDAAHRRGIVHRDLKPGNVMLTRAGVKLLDFGLAKFLRPETGVGDATSALTEEKDVTRDGAIVGTLAYMAPEQLEGKGADARSDIFALGAVIYEMVTGRKAFSGSNQASLLSNVMTAEPPRISATMPAAPPALDRLVRVSLAKDPADRWQSAHDVGLELDGIREAGSPPASVRQRRPRPAWIPWLAAAMGLAAAVGLVALLHPRAALAPALPVIRFSIPPPEGGNFLYSAESDFFSPSPDGSKLAYLGREKTGERRIFVRPLASPEQVALPGTDGARSLFWSPDSRSLAFVAEDKLMRIDVPGSSGTVSICDVPRGFGMTGSWGSAGEILFASIQGDAIYRVPVSGGQPALVLKPDRSRGEFRTHWPWFLPDGRRYLYLSRGENNAATLKLADPGKQTRDLMPIQSFARYADPGFLLFTREGALLAQRFDLESGRVRGEPFSIAPKVRTFRATGAASFATSVNGVLALQTKQDVMRLVWFDRTGRELSTVGSPGRYGNVRISRDGRRALVDQIRDGIDTFDIWSLDLKRGTQTAVTTDPGTEFGGVLLPDGKSIAFSMTRGRTPRLFRRDLAARKDEPMRPDNGRFQIALDVSRDGRFLLFGEQGEAGTMDTWVYPLSGGGQPFPFVKSPYNKSEARFSPDGRYVAFISDESGSLEAYVTPFPGPGERVRVSTAGALHLQWSLDGRELFYLSADRHLTAVAVQTSPTLHLGAPVPLFVWKGEIGRRGALERGTTSRFDVSPDGQRFLAVVSETVVDDLPLSVIVNWPAEIPR
jgi:eukaryotic-like serine/threonine-protein kinase